MTKYISDEVALNCSSFWLFFVGICVLNDSSLILDF